MMLARRREFGGVLLGGLLAEPGSHVARAASDNQEACSGALNTLEDLPHGKAFGCAAMRLARHGRC